MQRFGWLLLTLYLTGLTWSLPPERSLVQFLQSTREKVKAGDVQGIRQLGEREDTVWWHIWLRGKDQLNRWNVELLPAPRGYGKEDEWWIIFHKFQTVEELADRVHPVVNTQNGWRLGAEVPEGVSVPFRIEFHDLEVRLDPEKRFGSFTDMLQVKRITPEDRALWMRLNSPYQIKSAQFNGQTIPVVTYKDDQLPDPPDADLWLGRAGGVVWLQSKEPLPMSFTLRLEYEANVWFPPVDRIGTQYALLCSYWYPHIGRLPTRHRVTIHAPKNWIAIGQGELVKEEKRDESYTATWENELPVCFFSMVAGPYQITAEARSKKNNRLIRMYQLKPTGQAKQVVEKTTRGMDFFEERFGPFPYRHYYLVDTPDFEGSGLEAYSFTFLDPMITLWACTHELAHSYWGGVVPNTYLRSIWNESMAQYSDSVLFSSNNDATLEMGLNSMSHSVPVGSAYNPRDGVMAMAGYMRGSYVLRMLENELGTATMIKAMRTFAEKRRGQASEWEDFERIVKEVTGRDYGWFFRQWIYTAEFPTVEIVSATQRPAPKGGYLVEARLRQSGASQPFRLRFLIELQGKTGIERPVVVFSAKEAALRMESSFRVQSLRIVPDEYALIRKPPVYRLPLSEVSRRPGPTVVVYGSRDPTLKKAAQTVATWLAEKGYREVALHSDEEVDPQALEVYSVVLLGRADQNAVVQAWSRSLSGSIQPEGIPHGGKMVRGALFNLQSHPKERGRFCLWLAASRGVPLDPIVKTALRQSGNLSKAVFDPSGKRLTYQTAGGDPFEYRW